MKKRVFSLLLAVIIILPLFSVPVTAAGKTDIAVCAISGVKSVAVYTGGKIVFNVAVKHGSKLLKHNGDFALTYTDNTNIGTGSVTVKGIGEYTGAVTKNFKIVPAKVKLKSVEEKGGKVTLKWDKAAEADGYKIYCATSHDGKYERLKTIKDVSTVSYTTKTLTKGKLYCFYIVAFKKAGGKNYTSEKSPVKSIRTEGGKKPDAKGYASVIGKWEYSLIIIDGKAYTVEEWVRYIETDEFYQKLLTAAFENFEMVFQEDGTGYYTFPSWGELVTETFEYVQDGNEITAYFEDKTYDIWFISEDGGSLIMSQTDENNYELLIRAS